MLQIHILPLFSFFLSLIHTELHTLNLSQLYYKLLHIAEAEQTSTTKYQTYKISHRNLELIHDIRLIPKRYSVSEDLQQTIYTHVSRKPLLFYP